MEPFNACYSFRSLGNFNKAEGVLKSINKKGYTPSVIFHTVLMEAYEKAHQ